MVSDNLQLLDFFYACRSLLVVVVLIPISESLVSCRGNFSVSLRKVFIQGNQSSSIFIIFTYHKIINV